MWGVYKRKIDGTEVLIARSKSMTVEWYIEHICKMLQHLPATEANEIECKALWINVVSSHEDIADKLAEEK